MLNYAQNYGEFVTITIENMSEEHNNISHGDKPPIWKRISKTPKRSREARRKEEDEPKKDYALIAVSSGRAR
jgi:dihydroxyacetone kinase-like predicted kinase